MNWYYAAQGQQVGPFDDAAFQDLVSKGEIQSTTLVWHSGMSGWKPLSEVESQRGESGGSSGLQTPMPISSIKSPAVTGLLNWQGREKLPLRSHTFH